MRKYALSNETVFLERQSELITMSALKSSHNRLSRSTASFRQSVIVDCAKFVLVHVKIGDIVELFSQRRAQLIQIMLETILLRGWL